MGEVSEAVPCGGCGARTDRERCIGCFHDFGTPESKWVRDYASTREAPTPSPISTTDSNSNQGPSGSNVARSD